MDFFQLLASNTPNNTGPDGLRWKGSKDGVFASRSFYHVLNDKHGEHGVLFPWKGIWAVKPLLGFLSSFGQQHGGGSLLVTILCGEDTQW